MPLVADFAFGGVAGMNDDLIRVDAVLAGFVVGGQRLGSISSHHVIPAFDQQLFAEHFETFVEQGADEQTNAGADHFTHRRRLPTGEQNHFLHSHVKVHLHHIHVIHAASVLTVIHAAPVLTVIHLAVIHGTVIYFLGHHGAAGTHRASGHHVVTRVIHGIVVHMSMMVMIHGGVQLWW